MPALPTPISFSLAQPELRGRTAPSSSSHDPGDHQRETVFSRLTQRVICLDDCIVSENNLIGAEGKGLHVALQTLDLLRCSVGAAAVGLAQRAFEEAIVYSQQRRQFGRSIAEFQGIEFKLAEMATNLEAARLLVYGAAWAHDNGSDDFKQKSSMAKLFASEAAQHIVTSRCKSMR